MAPARPMPRPGASPAASGPAKLLRACIVQDGRVVDEQRFRRREPLSIGSAPRNTFVISHAEAPLTHELFALRGNAYELRLTPAMHGTVSLVGGEAPLDLATLRAQGILQPRGELLVMPLTDAHRGKIVIGDTAVVFQFVAPPPAHEGVALPPAAKGEWWRQLDGLYVLCYLLTTLVAVGTVVTLRFQPRPAAINLETMDDRFAKLIVPERKPADKKLPEQKRAKEPEATPKEAPKKAAEAAPPRAAPPRPAPVAEPEEEPDPEAQRARAERRANIRKSIGNRGLLAVLGTAGAGSAGGAVADVLGSGSVGGDLDGAFAGLSGVGTAEPGQKRGTRGGGAGTQASISGLQTSGGGKRVAVGGKREAKVGQVKAGEAEVDGALDSGQIAKVVQGRMRMVQDCYERELKRDGSLAGKIEIEFTIGEDGRVEAARVSSNKMGSDAVAQCIVGRIRTWRFPRPSGGSVTVNFPFIFAPSS